MNRTKMIFALLLILTWAESAILIAQTENKKLEITGQLRMRGETDDRDLNSDTESFDYTYLRTRVNFKSMFSDRIIGFVQLQDSRLFGDEDTSGATGTLKNTANVDMHLGYVEIHRLFWNWLSFKFGRMEFDYGAQRLLGSNPWNNIGRAFDGSVTSLTFKKVQIDLINVTLYESNMAPNIDDGDMALNGIWTKIDLAGDKSVDAYVLNDTDQKIDANDNFILERITLGSRFKGKLARFDVETELNLQTGKMDYTRDILAYYFSGAIGYTFPSSMKPNITLALDYLSGDKPGTDKYECFNTLYPATHRYFGYIDYFKDIPKNTRSLGLNDAMLKLKLKLMDRLSLKIDGHYFQLCEATVLQDGSSSRDLGAEIDLTFDFDYCKNVQFRFGGSAFAPGNVFKEWKGEDPSFWFYGQTTFDF